MKRLLIILTIAAAAAIATPAAAQTPEVRVGRPIQLQADHDGLETDGYRVYLCAGAQTDCPTQVGPDVPASAQTGGVVTTTVTAVQTRGTYTMQLSAFNEDHEIKSAPLVFLARRGRPATPANLRVLTLSEQADGSLNLRLVDLAELVELLELPPIPSTRR